MTYITSKQKMTSRRAVAPIIATLLLVAIAVVGGSIVFVFSQGFFSSAQVSGAPAIESLRIAGYDATDGTVMKIHDGTNAVALKGAVGNGVSIGERVAVYVQNNSVSKVTLGEIRLGGTVYSFVPNSAATLDPWTLIDTDGIMGTPATPSYVLLTQGPADTLLVSTSAELQPGQQATLVFEVAENIKTGRDAQFKLTSTNGAVFVGTVIAGQQSG
jgi:flagellin-like protein